MTGKDYRCEINSLTKNDPNHDFDFIDGFNSQEFVNHCKNGADSFLWKLIENYIPESNTFSQVFLDKAEILGDMNVYWQTVYNNAEKVRVAWILAEQNPNPSLIWNKAS